MQFISHFEEFFFNQNHDYHDHMHDSSHFEMVLDEQEFKKFCSKKLVVDEKNNNDVDKNSKKNEFIIEMFKKDDLKYCQQ